MSEAKKPVKRLSKEEKIAKIEAKKKELLEKQKQLEARIQKLQATNKEKERKNDTRRKIIAGGWFLSIIAQDEKAKALYALFLANLKEKEKELFK